MGFSKTSRGKKYNRCLGEVNMPIELTHIIHLRNTWGFSLYNLHDGVYHIVKRFDLEGMV